jgi:hypothetical protein
MKAILEGKARLSGFTQGLTEFGWTEGRNVRMAIRWPADNVDLMRAFAKELVDLQPDVILASNTPATRALQRETRMIPIVFSTVSDPVGEGFIASISRPGGNITGFINLEALMGESGCNCSRRSRRASIGPYSCSIPSRAGPGHITFPHSRRRPGCSKWNRSQRLFTTT